jgi:cysteinyl-tRNA synthetase
LQLKEDGIKIFTISELSLKLSHSNSLQKTSLQKQQVAYFCNHMSALRIYNSYSRAIEKFTPINPPHVGIYVCGPTVYGDPHLGHVRGPVTFDVLFRYLNHLEYRVRMVRNITDVGHLVDDSDDGDDKIAKKARLEKLEPMEIAHQYTVSYHEMLRALNVSPVSIEPRASGHIPEQINMIAELIEKGFAYESKGSVYFDVAAYHKEYTYGKLSGRVLEELMAGSSVRELEGQDEKRNPNDFALWKKASAEHIMKWDSPWSKGFPGWHIECSAMSSKYLGAHFDIHGGGMDLLFPHHECEIAQSTASNGQNPAKYWMHHNMITINGQKMAKSLGNGILVHELFSGDNPLLNKSYSPMTLRFFVLQAHYRGTLDFSNQALESSEKGLERLLISLKTFNKIKAGVQSDFDVEAWKNKCFDTLNDDMNTPMLIAQLFEGVKQLNLLSSGKIQLTETDLTELKKYFQLFILDILGLKHEETNSEKEDVMADKLIRLLIDMRLEARNSKNFALSDEIRDKLAGMGVTIKDTKDGAEYSIE